MRGIRRLVKVLLRPLGIVVLGLPVYLMLVGFTGQATALAIASVVGFLAPFVLQKVALKGGWMLLITWAASVVIAIVAEIASGDVKFNPLPNDPGQLYLVLVYTFGVTQAVFAYFKDHPLGPFKVA